MTLKGRRGRADAWPVALSRALVVVSLIGLAWPAASSAGWDTAMRLGATDADVSSADVDAAAGRVAITWASEDGRTPRTQWATAAAVADPVRPPIALGSTRGGGQVAVDPATGAAVVAWTDWERHVHAAVLPADGSAPSPPVVVGRASVQIPVDQVTGPIAVSAGSGVLTIAWVADTDAGLQVRAVRATVALGLTAHGPEVAVSEPFQHPGTAGTQPLELLAAPQPAGTTLLAWTARGESAPTAQLHATVLPAVGDAGDPEPVSDPTRWASGAALDTDDAGNAVLAWVDATPGWSTGEVVTATRPVLGGFADPVAAGAASGATRGPSARYPAVALAVAPTGAAVVAWDRADQRQQHGFSAGPAVLARGSAMTGAFGAPEAVPHPAIALEGVAVGAAPGGDALVAVSGGSFSGVAAARVPAGAPASPAAALECPSTWSAPVAAILSDDQALVLWRHVHPARDVRGLLLSRPGAGPDVAPCARRGDGQIVSVPARPHVGQEVLVDASAMVDPEASHVTVTWRVDPGPGETQVGGGTSTGSDPRLRHTFTTPGEHVVDLDLVYRSWRGDGYFAGTAHLVVVCPEGGCPSPAPAAPPAVAPPGGTGLPSPAPGAHPPATTTPASRMVTAIDVRRAVKRGTLRRRGLSFGLRMPRADRVTARLLLPGGRELAVRRLRAAAGTTQVRLRLHRRGRAALARSRARRITLVVRTVAGRRVQATVRLAR